MLLVIKKDRLIGKKIFLQFILSLKILLSLLFLYCFDLGSPLFEAGLDNVCLPTDNLYLDLIGEPSELKGKSLLDGLHPQVDHEVALF